MLATSSAFRAYVDRAREGRTALWRTLFGGAVIVGIWLAFSMAAAFPMFIAGGAADGSFFKKPLGLALALASFAGIWCGVWVAVRLLQRRSFASVLGASGRIARRDFVCGLIATLAICTLAELATYAVDPSLSRSAIGFGEWLLWLIPAALLVLVQSSAEEVAFRGYFMQSLAARFRSPWVWALLPGLVFTLLHITPDALPWMHASLLATIAAFAFAATLLVVATGNLGAAIGAHWGLNVFGLLGVSHTGWLSGLALFEGRPMEGAGWSIAEAAWLTLIGVGQVVLILVLLLNRRSPLRVGDTAGDPGASAGG